MTVFVAPLALLLERLLGYPQTLVRLIGHPVIWFGALISALEGRLNRPEFSPRRRKGFGVLTVMVLLLAAVLPSILIVWLCRQWTWGWVVEAFLATPFLAQKELGRAVGAVADGLRVSLADGRRTVSHVVGRDPEQLDEAGVARAAVETLAENASDGVIAPLFWLIVAGLPGIAAYKAVNTADSMIGHLNERYRDFGWAGARLDDLLNLVPARLTAGLFAVAALFVRRADAPGALRAALRDAKKHNSPNAGWPEAAMAGALGFSLGGPRSYGGETVDLPTMGQGRRDLGPEDIDRALQLYRRMLDVTLVGTAAVAAAIWLLV